jgi:hypothetical protein
MSKVRITQYEIVLKHLREHGSISDLEAYQMYAIRRLGARVWELRNAGHSIRTEYVTKPNRYGVKTTFANYVLED